MSLTTQQMETVFRALDSFAIELPSWGFANTGTRFGKFLQPAAATSIEEKFSDAGQVHLLTGICPTLALHVLWDFSEGVKSTSAVEKLASQYGVQPGSINPNVFEEQCYKYGSFGNPDKSVRERALRHTKDSIEIACELRSRDISMWFADGSNYPGTANIRQRKQWFVECLKASHAELAAGQRLPEWKAVDRNTVELGNVGLCRASVRRDDLELIATIAEGRQRPLQPPPRGR